jgi:hypothetical protein
MYYSDYLVQPIPENIRVFFQIRIRITLIVVHFVHEKQNKIFSLKLRSYI